MSHKSKNQKISTNISNFKTDILDKTYKPTEIDPMQIPSESNIQQTNSNKGNISTIGNITDVRNSPSLMMGVTQNTRISINLEDVLIQEDKLWQILDHIRLGSNFNFSAEEYLEFSQITSVKDFQIFFSEEKTKSILNQSMIFEYVVVMLSCFIYLKNLLTVQSVEHLKNILYYSHQNLLLTISLLIKKVDKEYANNNWVNKLKTIIKNKKSSFVKGNSLDILEQNNSILLNGICNFLLTYFNNENEARIFAILNDILMNITKVTIENVKNNLMNLKNMILHCAENAHSSIEHINLPGPFLPKMNPLKKKVYTLVLDLDETIIHCPEQHEIQPLIRPGTQQFLSELSPYFEIVIFTAGIQEYADTILDIIDKDKKWIDHRLYRQHTTVLKRSYCKDIAKLGRDLSKTIIIDNACDNFQLQIDNGIFITTWIDDESDTALIDLIPILKEIALKKVKDVRKALRKVRDTMMRFYVKGDANPYGTVLSIVKEGQKKSK